MKTVRHMESSPELIDSKALYINEGKTLLTVIHPSFSPDVGEGVLLGKKYYEVSSIVHEPEDGELYIYLRKETNGND